jgi:hypothetical protein
METHALWGALSSTSPILHVVNMSKTCTSPRNTFQQTRYSVISAQWMRILRDVHYQAACKQDELLEMDINALPVMRYLNWTVASLSPGLCVCVGGGLH